MYISFSDAIDGYFVYLKSKLKCTTYENNTRKIKLYILAYFRDMNIFKLTTKDYLEWKIFMNSKQFGYSYKASLHYCFCDFLDYCITFLGLDHNVARMVGNFRNDSLISTGNIWTIDDFQHFISKVDDRIYNALFNLLFFTGVRKGEALALTWNDINFNNKTIFINKSITNKRSYDNRNKYIITRPKSNKSIRILSIDDNLYNRLYDLKNYYREQYFDFDNNFFVFGGRNSISFTTLERNKNNYCKLARVKQIKIHEFRHSHACFLFQNDIPVEDISYRLGHSSLSMTMDTYLKYLPRNEKRVINTLNSLH